MSGTACCAACAGVTAETPVTISNPPGLPAVAARAGTYGSFLASMLAGLSDTDRPALAGFTSRAPDDVTISLLDAFACVADVLTFYQERIAQENYLRTATEQRSVLELARLIGYELAPGGELVPLGYFFPSAGFTDEHSHLLLARPVIPSPRGHHHDANEAITGCRAFSQAEFRAMIARGEIRDANTLAAFARLVALSLVAVAG